MADYGADRKRVWRMTGQKAANGSPIMEDMEYDFVRIGTTEVFEPSVSAREIRNDGLVNDRQYVGIHILQDTDTAISTPFGAGWGGMRRVA